MDQQTDQNPEMPLTYLPGHWTPESDAPEIALIRKKHFTAVIVWRAMLRDALCKPGFRTSQSLSDISAETTLSKTTIMRAQGQLLQAGVMTRETGGGTSRKPTTFIIPMPKKYRGKVNQMQETGEWTL
jgi:hypothetical protein